eukprot:m.210269 g.210269  ORF g.210269 m.210269 type:complete len:81 (+) comp19003_c0_seq4:135-377(+)
MKSNSCSMLHIAAVLHFSIRYNTVGTYHMKHAWSVRLHAFDVSHIDAPLSAVLPFCEQFLQRSSDDIPPRTEYGVLRALT